MLTDAKLRSFDKSYVIWIPDKLTIFRRKGPKGNKSDYHYAPTCFLLISDGGMPITCLKARLKLAGELKPVS